LLFPAKNEVFYLFAQACIFPSANILYFVEQNSGVRIENSVGYSVPDNSAVCGNPASIPLPYKATVYTQVELPPLIPPWKWGKQEIQFPPLDKGRVRVG
jgi:hypothetical protein